MCQFFFKWNCQLFRALNLYLAQKYLRRAKNCSKVPKVAQKLPSTVWTGLIVKGVWVNLWKQKQFKYMGETETVSSRAIILATLCDCLDSKGCEYSISTSASRRFKLHGLIGKKKKAFSITVRSAGWRQVAEILWTNCRQLYTDLWTELSIEL